jgi:MoaA/NifB/PqqE/SkfB family radical SAM enzyme
MKLDEIGFYTLSDNRAKNTNINSDLWRCELIVTSKCNFNCPYCRGIKNFDDLSLDKAKNIIQKWIDGRLKNVRFSGGEPTLWPYLIDLVKFAKDGNIENIAISTNGFSDISVYKDLIDAGVNDFSISLDACCSSIGDMMSGGINGSWDKVTSNIKEISSLTYTSVGVVMDDRNIGELNKISEFAYSLDVSDIRILSSAQWNNKEKFKNLCTNNKILNKYPINVRGICKNDSNKCNLMIDDMVIMNNNHYPCIIHMRESENPIGSVKNKTIEEIRKERQLFISRHNTHEDPICRKNCLDVCIDYNNKVEEYKNV